MTKENVMSGGRLQARANTYRDGFLVSKIADLMQTKRDANAIRANIPLLNDGKLFVEGILEGHKFIFQNGEASFAVQNVRLYGLFKRNLTRFLNSPTPEAEECLDVIRKVEKDIKSIIDDPSAAGEQSYSNVSSFFSVFADIFYEELEESLMENRPSHRALQIGRE
jgi:hypothetical protein